LQLEGLRLWC